MTLEQQVLEKMRTLPPATQQEILNFVELVANRQSPPASSSTLLEAAQDLIGAISDLPPDLSTNPAYLQEFGQS
jgi:hypothetical protein